MTVPKDFDLDMEYMLIDLNLKSALVDFDLDLFVESSKEFIDGCDHRSDLVNFSSVLYILVYKNPKIRDEKLKEIIEKYHQKIEEFGGEDEDSQNNTTKAILNLIKN